MNFASPSPVGSVKSMWRWFVEHVAACTSTEAQEAAQARTKAMISRARGVGLRKKRRSEQRRVIR